MVRGRKEEIVRERVVRKRDGEREGGRDSEREGSEIEGW